MADGDAQWVQYGPYQDANGTVYTGIKAYCYEPNTTNFRSVWTAANRTGKTLAAISDANSDGLVEFYGDGSYDIVIKQSDETPIITHQDVKINQGGGKSYASSYDDLDAAVKAITTTETTLVVDKAFDMGATTVTVPSTLHLEFLRNGEITITAGETLIVNGPITAGLWKIFDSAGSVVFGISTTVYPEWWGAVRDGSTDDGPEIEDAIASLTSGGVCKLGAGTYALGTIVNFISSVSLIGEGQDISIIKLKDNSDINMLNVSNVSDVNIEHLTVDGNHSNQTANGSCILCHSNSQNTSQIRISHCNIINSFIQGVSMTGTADGYYTELSSVTDCYIAGNQHRGCNISNQTRFITISNNIFNSNKKSHIASGNGRCTNHVYSGNSMDLTTESHGITLHQDISSITVTGNIITNSADDGIGIASHASDITISGNVINGNTGDGIDIAANALDATAGLFGRTEGDIERITITGNVIRSNGNQGIALRDDTNQAAQYIIINGNSIHENTAWGIVETSNADNNIIINNDLISNTSGAYSGSTSSVIRNNTGYVTFNGGLSAAIATGATIAHGLGTTPTRVSVTPTVTGLSNVYVSADANNITVNYAGGGSNAFYWEASVY